MVGRCYLLTGYGPVVVLTKRPNEGPRNVLVMDADGRRFVRPFRGLRRLRLAEGRS